MSSYPLVTIFTPTYNRLNHLSNLYSDLCNQTSKNFVWLVIDDGSSDGTERYFEKIKREGLILVEYVKKKNGGKHTAYNLACEITKTELLFIAMDSDDRLKPDAILEIENAWNKHKDNDIAGMVFLCEDINGKKLVKRYDRNMLVYCSLKKAYQQKWFLGEAEYILKTNYAREFKYPEYKGEIFFNEAYTYMQMDQILLWTDKSIYIRDYQMGGLSDSFLQNVYNSPNGYADYNNMRCKITLDNYIRIKGALLYDTFSLLAKRKGIINNANCKICAFVLFPFGFAFKVILDVICIKRGWQK